MKPKAKTHRSVDIGRLYKKLLTWLYERLDIGRAQPVAHRLKKALARFSPEPESIFIEECRSLISEAEGDLASAIKHRENEVRLIRHLHQISQDTPSEEFVFGQYDYMDLSDRLDLLAMLYRDSGNLSKAISALEESKRLCDEHGVKFDGYDILEEYMKDANVDYLPGVEVSENGKYLVTLLPPSKYASTTTIKDVVAIGISTPRARIEHMKASGTPPPLAPSPSWLPADWIAPRLSSIPVVGLLEHHP